MDSGEGWQEFWCSALCCSAVSTLTVIIYSILDTLHIWVSLSLFLSFSWEKLHIHVEFDKMCGVELFLSSLCFVFFSKRFQTFLWVEFCTFASTVAFNELVWDVGLVGGGGFFFDVFHHEAAHRCTEAWWAADTKGSAQRWEKLLLRIITPHILRCSWLELMCCLNQNLAASREMNVFFFFFYV